MLSTVFLLFLVSARGQAGEGARTEKVSTPAFGVLGTTRKPDGPTLETANPGRLNEFKLKLQALQQRIREDARLQRGAVAVELAAAVLGTVRGRGSVTGVSTHALRLGLSKPLTRIRERSGLDVEPSIGYRTLGVTVTRRFR